MLFDKLEWQSGDGASALHWDNAGWIGRDRDRLWFRSEGDRGESGVERAEAQVFYGRAISRRWDLVGGVRQEFRPGPAVARGSGLRTGLPLASKGLMLRLVNFSAARVVAALRDLCHGRQAVRRGLYAQGPRLLRAQSSVLGAGRTHARHQERQKTSDRHVQP